MSGPSLDITQIPKLALDLGYAFLADEYQPDTEHFRRFCDVAPTAIANSAPYGHRAVSMAGLGDLSEIEDGQEIPADTMGEGYPVYGKIRRWTTRVSIPDRVTEAFNARAQVEALVSQFASEAAKQASIKKDLFIAGMFQKGTLSAGSAQFFDNSFGGQADPYPAFIYDGKPLFAASGNAHPLKFATNTGAQGVNLTVSSALSATTLDSAYTAMSTTNAIDERGNRILNIPRRLMVGPSLRATAMTILDSQLLPGTAQNDINYNRGVVDLVVNPYLTDDSDAWWLLGDGAGVQVLDDGAPMLSTARDELRKVTHLIAEVRFGAFVKNWRKAAAYNKAAS